MAFINPKVMLLTLTAALGAKTLITAPDAAEEFQNVDFMAGAIVQQSAFSFETEQAPSANEEADAPEVACEIKETPEQLLQIIENERATAHQKTQDANAKMAEAELLREKLAVETERLNDLKTELTALLTKIENSQTADLDRLVTLYSSMKPKQAAGIMNDLDVEVSVMVMAKMDERKAAPILAQMNPVRSRAISKIIFERSKLPGDQNLNGIRLN